MDEEKKTSIVISPENLVKINGHLKAIENLLPEGLFTLTPEQRKGNLKMGDKNASFIGIALEQAKLNPDIVYASLKVLEMENNLKIVADYSSIIRYMTKIMSPLKDTLLVTGGNVFSTSLSIYKVFQDASKRDVIGAKEGEKELKNSFPGHKPKLKNKI